MLKAFLNDDVDSTDSDVGQDKNKSHGNVLEMISASKEQQLCKCFPM